MWFRNAKNTGANFRGWCAYGVPLGLALYLVSTFSLCGENKRLCAYGCIYIFLPIYIYSDGSLQTRHSEKVTISEKMFTKVIPELIPIKRSPLPRAILLFP